MPIELPRTENCLFCEVEQGRREKGVVKRTELTLTLVNNRQFEHGQLLVIPRRHAPTLLELNKAEMGAVMDAAHRAASALIAAFDPDGITLYQNNGVVSLQEVPHFHLHVVPRRKASQWRNGPPHIAVLEKPEARPKVEVSVARELELAAQISAHLPSVDS